MTTTEVQTRSPRAAGNPARKKALLTLLGLVVAVGLAWTAYEWLVASHYESTDNAYVQGNVIQITPQVGGTVLAILADDTDYVKAGQALVRLDPADVGVALDQARANLAQVVRQVRTLYANNGTLGAQIKLRESDVARAQVEIARATDDLQRRQSLIKNGAVSKEDLNHAQTQLANGQSALTAAQAALAVAREQLLSNQTMTDGISIDRHPSVLAAAAKVREAWLASQRMSLPAPVEGCRPAQCAVGTARGSRHTADVDRAHEPDVGRCQLQRSSTAQHPHRPKRQADR